MRARRGFLASDEGTWAQADRQRRGQCPAAQGAEESSAPQAR